LPSAGCSYLFITGRWNMIVIPVVCNQVVVQMVYVSQTQLLLNSPWLLKHVRKSCFQWNSECRHPGYAGFSIVLHRS
jgi:hypothetical protein